MLYKLLQLGMDRRLWAIIFYSYTDFRCAVNIDGVLSEWFSPSQGVHQGDVMSMYLYCIYNNDLLEELLDVACPLKINNHILTCPAFADDVAIVSKSSASLQHKVDIAKCHSRKWRYNLSIPKIRIVAFNPITKGQPCKITLDNQLLQCVDGHIHVGVPLCASVAAERIFCDERVRQHRTFCCMVLIQLRLVNSIGLWHCPGFCTGAKFGELVINTFHCSKKLMNGLPERFKSCQLIALL